MEKPGHGYCCSGHTMYQIMDDVLVTIDFICSNCASVYKYKLEKEE